MSVDGGEISLGSRLAAARNGCSRSLGELLEEFRPFLKSIAGEQLGSTLQGKASDSDVAQESLIQAAAGFSGFRGETVGEFRNWLAQIIEHRAIDLARHFRSQKRDVARESRQGQDRLRDVIDAGPSPSADLRQKETLEQLVDFLGTLSAEERQLLRWRYTDAISFDEIASRLGWPRETTRRRWYDLIDRLGRRLEQGP